MGRMPGQNPDSLSARRVDPPDERRVKLAIGQCETLSILPAVAARFFAQIGRMELTPSSLTELIESDPALMALVLRLCHNKGIIIKQCDGWLLQVMGGLSLREIRDAVLSAKICGGFAEDARTDFRKELTHHSAAVACCAERLAQLTSPPLEAAAAYMGGLLHDIGKFLLDEAMPKSFDTLLEQARAGKTSFCRVEQENLGLDHTILGKRFAQKLRLPSDVILGIWLHHSQTGTISQAMPQARIAAVVELADCIVRRAGIGDSGSYDEEAPPETIAGPLGLTAEQIRQVEQQLPDLVRQKSEVAGLTLLKPGWAYCDALRATAGQLAAESTKLFDEGNRLQSSASHFDFVRELLPKINSTMSAVELAEEFAVGWQRFYQTGPVCVYLVGEAGTKAVEAVVVESAFAGTSVFAKATPDKPADKNQTSAKTAVFNVPEDAVLIPEPVSEKFAVLDAADYVDWLLEQIEVDFDLTRTKLAPLQAAGGRTVGVIVFELRHPMDGEIAERFGPAARLGGMALDMLETIGRQQWYAERFAQMLGGPGFAKMASDFVPIDDIRTTPDKTPGQAPRLDSSQAGAMAEMAAGAAHELNNPLSVISGRAQLLAKSETDADRRRILEQIQQNAGELAAIIDDLMSYANPEKPRPTETAVRQIINEAAELASQKKGTSRLDIKIDVPPDAPNVFVDSAQIACAISNIICNGLESYETERGPLAINASADNSSRTVNIRVIDSGRGMDEQTLRKAMQPFFSNKPAGRKRGMGLAHAQRLIEINNGTLDIASQPGKGTTVTVTLPSKLLDTD
jgi:putative nucleotidyltransferase with HDIG domain